MVCLEEIICQYNFKYSGSSIRIYSNSCLFCSIDLWFWDGRVVTQTMDDHNVSKSEGEFRYANETNCWHYNLWGSHDILFSFDDDDPIGKYFAPEYFMHDMVDEK